MNTNNKYIQLFPCCKIVQGKLKDAIYDLQREEYYLIPHSLTKILEESQYLSLKELQFKYKSNIKIFNEYLDFLNKNELIFIDNKLDGINELNTSFSSSSIITNAILDFDRNTSYNIKSVIDELDVLRCENVELRFYNETTIQRIKEILNEFENTGIRDLELLLPHIELLNNEVITKLHLDFPRLRKITLHSAPRQIESVNIHDELCIIYTSEVITDESCCGVVNQWYMLPKTELFIESQHFNTCLNRKIGIDKIGNIKNCPSFYHSYGIVGEVKIADVVSRSDFQYYWKIRKEDISVCKDCELRHMCQDCRVYIENPKDIYSKPKKCLYNPYK